MLAKKADGEKFERSMGRSLSKVQEIWWKLLNKLAEDRENLWSKITALINDFEDIYNYVS